MRLLDIGAGEGPVVRYLGIKPHYTSIICDGADLHRTASPALAEYRNFFVGDVTAGYPDIESEAYDVVVCEQVLEHLHNIDTAIRTIDRVLKPGGCAIIGVPIFLPPLDLARKRVVPILDGIVRRKKQRGHVQAFTLRSFVKAVETRSSLRAEQRRGFRIISGGILRPLEYYETWWKLNRYLGRKLPSACIETQVLFRKPFAA